MTIKISEKPTIQCITNYTVLKIFLHLDLWYVLQCRLYRHIMQVHMHALYAYYYVHKTLQMTETQRQLKCRAVCQDRSVSLHVTYSLSPTHLLKIHPDILILNLFHSSAFFMFKLPCLSHQLSLVLGNCGAEITHESFHWPGCRISTLVMTAEVMGDITVLAPIVTERCSGDKARQAGRHTITQPFLSKRSLPCS